MLQGMEGPVTATYRRYGMIAALMFFVLTSVVWASLFTTARFLKRDAYDYAQLGRQLRSGQGFSTRQLFPRDLPYLHANGELEAEAWPSLHRYPALPVANALFLIPISDPVRASVVRAGFFFLLSIPLFFLLSARLSNLTGASLATVLFVGDPRVWRWGYDGMTESLAVLLLLAAFFVVFHPSALRGNGKMWMLTGFFCGIAYLARTQLVTLLPLGMLFIIATQTGGRRMRSAVGFCGVFLVVVSPWLIRNLLVTGNPFFSLTNTRALAAMTEHYHRLDIRLHEPVEIGVFLERAGGEVADKIVRNIFPTGLDPRFWFKTLGLYALAIPVLLVWVFVPGRGTRDPSDLFEWSVAMLLVVNFLMVATTYHRPRYYDPLIPLLIIVLVRRAWWLIEYLADRLSLRTRRCAVPIVALVLLAAACLRAGFTWAEHTEYREPGREEIQSYQILRGLTGRESLIVSDLSLEITLHNHNRTIRAPLDPDEIFEIDRDYLPVDFIVIHRKSFAPKYRTFSTLPALVEHYNLVRRLPNGATVYERKTGTGRADTNCGKSDGNDPSSSNGPLTGQLNGS
jgi:hypothetical protein